jgi:hypothetical protein
MLDERGNAMNDETLTAFREIASQMIGKAGWEWIGPHMSQRMFDITEKRAKDYARRFGGTARPMQLQPAYGVCDKCGTVGEATERLDCGHWGRKIVRCAECAANG